ncbi:BTAD domain-containing putative transcriptional regulator [Myceligenerans indicum]|uniref:LysM peptidoglycan-binding domain-containing protein n=1 Tax=Myceligenerans indicum TaxID=2593663 RepID=A0ABS1LF12_9MICO|nr:BTAD domain-containing putative transcriptional regulator [Myceligenerans indicum]MBL0884856.1 LysM peptidoglycan-binding domain-containing protein [Myceligenerans indicum]
MSRYQQDDHQPVGTGRPASAGRRVQGALALLVVLGLTVGLPYVLLFVAGNPLTNGVLDPANLLRILTSPDDGTLLMSLLQIVGWVAWVVLALSIVVELFFQVRGVRAPHLPGLGMPQGLARGLVGAVMLLFTVMPAGHAAALGSGVPSPGAVPPSSVATTLDQSGTGQGAATTPGAAADRRTVGQDGAAGMHGPASTAPEPASDANRGRRASHRTAPGNGTPAGRTQPAARADKDVVVRPGDTLWGIAEAELGDGSKYPELYEASQDVHQPGGARLTDPDLIHPGWTIQVPGAGDVVRHERAPGPRERSASTPERVLDTSVAAAVEANQAVGGGTGTSVAGAHAAGQEHAAHRVADRTPASPSDRAGGEVAAGREDADSVVDSSSSADGLSVEVPWQVTTATGAGALLAAGVVGLLAARRRDQQRTRRPGQTLPSATGALGGFEQATHAGADQPSVEAIDRALRSLAASCVGARRPLPVLRAARLTSRALELYLEHPALLPQPWTSAGDSTVWTLATADVVALPPVDRTAAPAPYPSLVTIGYDDDLGHVLLNLEHLGALGITGDLTTMDEILAAVALELATSIWADELQVTVVGTPAGLEPAMRTGRVRHLPSAGRVIDELARRVETDHAAIAAHDTADLYTARVTGAAPDTWAPEIVLLSAPVSDDERADLAALVADLPHVALATVTGGDAVGPWSLHLEDGGRAATLAPIGLRLVPQRLPAPQYEAMLELATLSAPGAPAGEAWPEPGIAEIEAAAAAPGPRIEPAVDGIVPVAGVERTPTAEVPAATFEATHVAPRILLLGPVDVVGARGPVDDRHKDRLLEYAAFLGLHRGSSPDEIDAAMWPGSVSGSAVSVRTSATARLRRWFGQDESGQDFLPRHQDEAMAFGPAVTTDVESWDLLVGRDPRRATTPNLTGALRLVRGLPFQDVHRRRFAWAQPLRERLIAEVVDAAFELARRSLLEGRWRQAEDAAAVGLRLEPAQESLWRLRILAAHQSSDPEGEAEAIERLLSITERLECNLQPETEQLLASLKEPGTDFERFMAQSL